MLDLATATPELFERAVGSHFAVRIGDGETLPIRLDEVVVEAAVRTGSRQPFVLRFSGPPSPVLAPLTHHLTHSGLGELELFLGPVHSGAADHVVYEAVFA